MISIVIRAKNESAWIGRVLAAIKHQSIQDYEVVLVDNASTDGTAEKAKRYGAKIVLIPDSEFTYGRALNKGIRSSTGDIIVSLSAHCIPTNNLWLQHMIMNFRRGDVAGVYGRQEPLPDSTPFDKRDLWITFGLDRVTQEKDPFFHNANSAIRRDVWEEIHFDEEIHGQEDRDWAKKVLAAGYKIIYEPRASVYHHHGIHQGRDEARAERVARVIEMVERKRM